MYFILGSKRIIGGVDTRHWESLQRQKYSCVCACVCTCLCEGFSDVDFPVWWFTCMNGWMYDDDEQKMKTKTKEDTV